MKTLKQIKNELEAATKTKEVLEKQVAEYEKFLSELTFEQKFAHSLHANLCSKTHIDDCNWFYEESHQTINWKSGCHYTWLISAREIIAYWNSNFPNYAPLNDENYEKVIILITKGLF